MSRKRDKPYPTRHVSPARISKRERPWRALPSDEIIDKPTTKPPPPPALVILGLPANSSVLKLKSIFEIYGSISRIRIDKDGLGYVSYRTAESGKAAIAASLEPCFGISIDSKKLEVVWETDPLVKCETVDKTRMFLSSSRLVRPEVSLRKHGRSNRLALAIADPRSHDNFDPRSHNITDRVGSPSMGMRREFKHREIVAYDDIL